MLEPHSSHFPVLKCGVQVLSPTENQHAERGKPRTYRTSDWTPVMSCHPSRYEHPRPVPPCISSLFFFLKLSCTMALLTSRLPAALRIARRRYPALRASRSIPPGCEQRRSFSCTSTWQIRTKEMNYELMQDLKVNQGRLMEDIHYTCQWGTGERWGEYASNISRY